MAQDKGNAQRTYFVSSQVRLLVGFTLLFTAVFAGAYYWFYRYSTDAATYRIEQDVLDTLTGAIAGVDVEQFEALVKEGEIREDGYTDDPRYWEHVAWLAKVGEIEPRAEVYTYIAGAEDKEVIFIGSIGAVSPSPGGDPPPWGATFKEHYTSTGRGSANLLTGLDHIGAKTETYNDKWGSWMSGWGPIVNEQGEKVGAMGVDFNADYVKEVQQGIKNSMLLAFAITYIILFVLVYLVSIFFTRPIVSLTQAAERVGEGNYDQDFSHLKKGRWRNEFSSLADVFEIMISKVAEREQNLRTRVQQLEIMIDEGKREKQVQEIVDSDFFRDLQAKAQRVRDRDKEAQQKTGDEE